MYYIDLEFFTATIKAPYCKKGKNYGLQFEATNFELHLYKCTKKDIYKMTNHSFNKINI